MVILQKELVVLIFPDEFILSTGKAKDAEGPNATLQDF